MDFARRMEPDNGSRGFLGPSFQKNLMKYPVQISNVTPVDGLTNFVKNIEQGIRTGKFLLLMSKITSDFYPTLSMAQYLNLTFSNEQI